MGNQSSLLENPSSLVGGQPSNLNNNKRSTLDLFAKRISLSKLNRFTKKKKKGPYYPVPPNAERPSPPSCPEVFQDQDQYFILRWDPPAYDGGCPIMGYVIQHLELGLPQLDNQDQDDAEAWYSSDPGQISQTECILNNLVPGTTYQFRVIAENLIGYSQPSDISEPIVFNPHGELDDWFFAPSFTMRLDEAYTVMEHEMLTLSVELKGQPYPTVKWIDKNDQELVKLNNNCKKYRSKSCGFTRTLTINSVELSDAGIIKCIGINKEGMVECCTNLNVEAPPRVKRVQSPEFLENPYDLNDKEEERLNLIEDDYEDLIFQSGELMRLKFLYSGSPKPEIRLFHNGELVTDPRVVTELTEKVITVKVENINRCDRGEWLMKLDNVLGEDCTSVLLTITDHPSGPGKPEILQLSDNTCILCWPEPPDDGGCPIHNYIVEYFRSEWGVWLKALTSKTLNAKIKDLIPGSKYKFRVKAENLYGVSEPSEESVEILITDLPSTRTNTGENGGLMSTVEESVEEEDEINSDKPQVQLKGRIVENPRLAQKQMKPDAKLPMIIQQPKIVVPPAQKSQIVKKEEEIKPIENQKLFSRQDIIKSSTETSTDYMRRFLDETMKPEEEVEQKLKSPMSFDEDEDFEYDFEKLQREYEEEMNLLRDDSEESESESDSDFEKIESDLKETVGENVEKEIEEIIKEMEFEPEIAKATDENWELEESVEKKIERERKEAEIKRNEIERIKRDIQDRILQEETEKLDKTVNSIAQILKREDLKIKREEDIIAAELESETDWKDYKERKRVIRSEEKSKPNAIGLGDKYTDYLTMKVASRNKKIGSSLRSLSSQTSTDININSSRDQSRENLKRMLDFDEEPMRKWSDNKPNLSVFELRNKSPSPRVINEPDNCYVRHADNHFEMPLSKSDYEFEEEKREQVCEESDDKTEEPEIVIEEASEIITGRRLQKRYALLLLLVFFLDTYVIVLVGFVVLLLLLLWNKYRRS